MPCILSIAIACSGGAEVHNHAHNHEHEHEHEHSAGHIEFSAEQAEAAGVETETVAAAPFPDVIKAGGKITAVSETVIAAHSGGIVSFPGGVVPPAGRNIRRGETIMTISAAGMESGDPIKSAKIEYEAAKSAYERAKLLVKDRIIPQKEFDEIRARYENAANAYGYSGKDEGYSVVASEDCYVKEISVSQGEYVAAGEPVAIVSQNKRLRLTADVSEKYFNRTGTLEDARFSPVYSNETYTVSALNGKVAARGQSTSGGGFYIPVTFEFDNPGNLVPGAFAEVYLLSVPRSETVSVPESAITEESGLRFVYIRIENDEYRKQQVTTGRSNGERIEIKSGVNPGDEVVVKGAYNIKLAAASAIIPEGHSHNH